RAGGGGGGGDGGPGAGAPARAPRPRRQRGDGEPDRETPPLARAIGEGRPQDCQLEPARAPPEKGLALDRPAGLAVRVDRQLHLSLLAGEVARPAVDGGAGEEEERGRGFEGGGHRGARGVERLLAVLGTRERRVRDQRGAFGKGGRLQRALGL